jgi:hypothetical protein
MEQKIIDKHAEDALKVVAAAASEATRVIAQAAQEALKVKNTVDTKDHDLIQRMDEKLDALSKDFKEIKDGTAARIALLEREKATCTEINGIYDSRKPQWKEFDNRLKALEKWRGWILGSFATIGIVVTLVVFIYMRDITRLETQVEKCVNHAQQIIDK